MRSVCLLVVLAGCGSAADPDPAPRKKASRLLDQIRPLEPASSSTLAGSCAVHGVELIYVVDNQDHLLSFDPDKLPVAASGSGVGGISPLRLVGTLTCSRTSHPHSMAVDRNGIAWIVYSDGQLYPVSIDDARCGPATRATGPGAPSTFGMGFATAGSGSTDETLYVMPRHPAALGTLDLPHVPPRWTAIGALDGDPELTGTGDGALFGYFPDGKPGFVQQIDPRTAARIGERYPVPLPAGSVEAWAVAQSGGKIYEFVTVGDDTAVHSIRRKTGEHRIELDHVPYRIVGAGVSTCAPELERAVP